MVTFADILGALGWVVFGFLVMFVDHHLSGKQPPAPTAQAGTIAGTQAMKVAPAPVSQPSNQPPPEATTVKVKSNGGTPEASTGEADANAGPEADANARELLPEASTRGADGATTDNALGLIAKLRNQ
jgi:hypothetical protein